MEEEPKKEANPYQDPTLIEQSHGDQELLHRIVARQMAASRLQEQPDSPTWNTLFQSVDMAVKDRQRQLGIELPEEETETPDS